MITIKRRIQIFTALLVLMTSIGMVMINTYKNWNQLLDQEFSKTESIARLLDKNLIGTYEDLLQGETVTGDRERIKLLNQKLQPFVNQVVTSFPGYGAGYYVKELHSIVAFGPEFHESGLKDIKPDSKARTVYKTKKLYKFTDKSQTRDSYVVAIIYPVIRHGEVIGHVWGNIKIGDVYSYFFTSLKERLFLLLVMLGIAYVGTHFITRQYIKSLDIFRQRVRRLDIGETEGPQFLPELMEIYNEVLLSRQKLKDSEKRFQTIVCLELESVSINYMVRLLFYLLQAKGQQFMSAFLYEK